MSDGSRWRPSMTALATHVTVKAVTHGQLFSARTARAENNCPCVTAFTAAIKSTLWSIKRCVGNFYFHNNFDKCGNRF